MRNLLYIFILILFISSCQKDPILENVIIENNNAPHYDNVTTVQIQNYINKIYIDLLGREPFEQELTDVTDYLRSNNLSETSREDVLIQLMDSEEYYKRFYDIYQVSYLPGVDQDELNFRILIFENEYDQAVQNGSVDVAQFYQRELVLFYALRDAEQNYRNGDITINEFMVAICNNNFYDEINMGVENFVLSCFENFLKRTPTDAELDASTEMVYGAPSQIFLQDGNNKTAYINIIMNVPEFYQGLAIDIYNQLLVREPSSEEMVEAIFIFDETNDYQQVQRKVMKSDEYAGF